MTVRVTELKRVVATAPDITDSIDYDRECDHKEYINCMKWLESVTI